jgi:hypothetical protein
MFSAVKGKEVQILQKCAHFRLRSLIADLLLFYLFSGTLIRNTEFLSQERQPSPASTLQYDSDHNEAPSSPTYNASESSPTHSFASEKTIIYDDDDKTETDSVCSFDESNAQGVSIWFDGFCWFSDSESLLVWAGTENPPSPTANYPEMQADPKTPQSQIQPIQLPIGVEPPKNLFVSNRHRILIPSFLVASSEFESEMTEIPSSSLSSPYSSATNSEQKEQIPPSPVHSTSSEKTIPYDDQFAEMVCVQCKLFRGGINPIPTRYFPNPSIEKRKVFHYL